MLCFLAAGLIVQTLPGVREKLEKAGTLPPPGAAQPSPESRALTAASEPVAVPPPEREGLEATGSVSSQTDEPSRDTEWFLYITGSVRNPGVYRLPPGARLFQLAEAAGGLDNFADSVAINMAALLEDGMHVHVPKKGERPENSDPTIIVEPTVVPSAAPRLSVGYGGTASRRSSLVDLNRATVEELTTLKGIGPVLAGNIVEYRTRNGRFRTVEDLLQVKGIGAKKLEGFRQYVIVGP